MRPSRRFILAAGPALLLAGCGDDEAAQRKAFIAFLQTRILDKPGVHVPHPTADEAKSWGEYAKHYAVITGFNDTLTERVSKPMQAVLQRGAVRSIAELLDRRADLQEMQRGMNELGAELDRQLAAAEAARAGLKQPPDLKAVFDAAFERDVAGPARTFKAVLPVVDSSLAAALDLANVLAQNRARIKIDGSQLQIADPVLQRDVQARLAAMNAKAQEVQAMQQRLRSLITGS